MKTKVILAGLFLSLTLLSCKKEDKKADEVATPTVENNDNIFKVTLDLLVKKNDTLHLYYTEDNSINFTEEHSVWLPVEGKNTNQEITFNLPEDAYPTQVRIDFGVNKENTDVTFKKAKFDYLGKNFTAVDSTLFMYFRADESNTVLDTKTGVIKRKDANQNTMTLYPHQDVLGPELMKLSK